LPAIALLVPERISPPKVLRVRPPRRVALVPGPQPGFFLHPRWGGGFPFSVFGVPKEIAEGLGSYKGTARDVDPM